MDIVSASILEIIKQKLFGGIFEELGWLMIGFKIVVLIFIIGFVRARFTDNTLVTILTLGLGYIVLFQYWYLFGPMMLIYLFIIFGFSAVLVDIAITKPWTKHAWTGKNEGMYGGYTNYGEGGEEESEFHKTGKDQLEYQKEMLKRMKMKGH